MNGLLRIDEGLWDEQLGQELCLRVDLLVLQLNFAVEALVKASLNFSLLRIAELALESLLRGVGLGDFFAVSLLDLLLDGLRELELDELGPLAHLTGLLPAREQQVKLLLVVRLFGCCYEDLVVHVAACLHVVGRCFHLLHEPDEGIYQE